MPTSPTQSDTATSQNAELAVIENEIAEKREKLELIEQLFQAMRKNTNEEDKEKSTMEIAKLQAEIDAM